MKYFKRISGFLIVLLSLALLGSIVKARPSVSSLPSFEEELKRYEDFQKYRPLDIRTVSMQRLADTRDPRALDILSKRYDNAPKGEKSFPDHVRYIIAGLAGENFDNTDFSETLDAWADRNTESHDVWLWYQTLNTHYEAKGADKLLEIVRDKKADPFFRAVSIEVLAENNDEQALTLISELLERPTKKEPERSVLLGSFAKVLLEISHSYDKKDAWNQAAEALALMLDERKTTYQTKLVIGRYFARIFSTDKVVLDSGPWINLIRGNAAAGDTHEGKTSVPRPRFLGVEATGMKIAYLIDMSDSMLQPLSVEEQKDLKKKPVITGKKRDKKDKDKERKKKKEDSGEDLPWDKVKNRFDAAREFLKLSLKGLNEDMFFTVVFFGNKAKYLKSTTGMVPATDKNIQAAIKELDAVEPGAPQPNRARPHGTLRGATNVHGSLRKAFKAVRGNSIELYEHVDAEGFETGCDTIFLLSDGRPSYDDFMEVDKMVDGYQTGDPETGQPSAGGENLQYYGPYHLEEFILSDLKRMNMFRKCEIHAIAIGEASGGLLQGISEIGMGTVTRIPE